MDQPGLAGRHPDPGERGFGRLVTAPLEPVGSGTGAPLLRLESGNDGLGGRDPSCIERRGIAARLPVIAGQPQHIAQRIDLPLALGHAGFHLGPVDLRPVEVRHCSGIAHEGIGVGIDQHAARVAADQPAEQQRQLRIAAHEGQVRPQLGRRIAQPQARNIAGDHERIGLARNLAHEHRGVERVGQAVLEQPGQFRIGDQRGNAGELGLDRRTDEPPRGGRRTLGWEHRLGLLRAQLTRHQQQRRPGGDERTAMELGVLHLLLGGAVGAGCRDRLALAKAQRRKGKVRQGYARRDRRGRKEFPRAAGISPLTTIRVEQSAMRKVAALPASYLCGLCALCANQSLLRAFAPWRANKFLS